MEDNGYLVAHTKPAFREMIEEAIQFGANVGSGVFKHTGEDRMRNSVVPKAVEAIDSTTEMTTVDPKLSRATPDHQKNRDLHPPTWVPRKQRSLYPGFTGSTRTNRTGTCKSGAGRKQIKTSDDSAH